MWWGGGGVLKVMSKIIRGFEDNSTKRVDPDLGL